MKSFRAFVTEDTAYKGYLIRSNPLNGLWWIEKDGQRISSAKDEADAKKTIDMLTEDTAANAAFHAAKLHEGFMGEVVWEGTVAKLQEKARQDRFDVRWEKGFGVGRGYVSANMKVYVVTDPDSDRNPQVYSEADDVFVGTCYRNFDYSKPMFEDAAANAAGNGGVAGIGVGPKGEPGVNLKKKRIEEEDDDTLAEWLLRVMGVRLESDGSMTALTTSQLHEGWLVWWHGTVGDVRNKGWKVKWKDGRIPADSTKVRIVSRDDGGEDDDTGPRYLETDDDNPRELGLMQEDVEIQVDKEDIEKAAKEVHDRWMDKQKEDGHEEHLSPDGEEDYMVPYEELSDDAKELDRNAVRAVLDALNEDGPLKPTDTFGGAAVFEVDMDRVMNIKGPKHPRHRYARYVGEDEVGESIRQHGRSKRGDIILKDQKTGIMTYLRRKGSVG